MISFPPIHPNTTPVLDSIQFGMSNFSVDQRRAFQADLNSQGIPLNVIGLAKDNARVFYNWKFIDEDRIKPEDFPRTKNFIESMCDLRLPYSLNPEEAYDLAERINAALSRL
jgi:perosamine synthetase